jgi:predicted DsbA family dithiol-disulfide isomerase
MVNMGNNVDLVLAFLSTMNHALCMQIEIIADVTCPWCFVGLKRLKAALGERPDLPTKTLWRPFLLNPDLQDGVTDRIQYLSRMFGSESRIQQFYEAIDSAGLTTGIPFSPDVDFTPSSINAHRLITMAETTGQHAEIAEELFYAYFVEGLDIADISVLAVIAAENGLDSDSVTEFLHSDDARNTVFEENARIHRLGINGVPSFVFDERNIVSGAQEVQTLVHILDYVAKNVDMEPKIPTAPSSLQSHGIGTP